MKKIINSIIGIVAIAILFTSCDKVVEADFLQKKDTTSNIIVKKNVLLEDFTGFLCGNCPEAREIGDKIHEKYGNSVIVIGVHAGGLAKPTPNRKYDFRTPEGNELEAYYALPATPYGMINRVPVNSKTLMGSSEWETATVAELQKESPVELKINANYNQTSREISLTSEIKYLVEGSKDFYLAAYLIEDSIKQVQKDDRLTPNVYVLDYNHMHVLRGSMDGTWGTQIADYNAVKGSTITKEKKFTIPSDKDWKPKDMFLVVFVHDNKTRQIQQAAKIKLIP